jgi:lipopolysaccharide export system permease protein
MIKSSAIPTLWRYFLWQYAKVFGLSLFGFLVILLSTRLEYFARFATLGANLSSIAYYVVLQIPYVMQIALPISSLIATLFLFQKLSQSNGLTALRAAGIGLTEIATPILLTSCLFAIFTFYFVLDMSAISHRKAKELEFKLRSMNPIALMHNSKMLEQKGISIEMTGSLQNDGKASDFIMAVSSKENGRTALFIAKEMNVEDDNLKGKNLTLISTLKSPEENHFDHLVIENSKENLMKLEDLSLTINTKRLRVGVDELKFSHLLARKNDVMEQHEERKILSDDTNYTKHLFGKCCSEIARRISLSLSIVTFAILGVAYGSTIGRHGSKRRIIKALLLTAFFLLCFLGAKAIEQNWRPAVALYLLPHFLLIGATASRLWRIQKGIEG